MGIAERRQREREERRGQILDAAEALFFGEGAPGPDATTMDDIAQGAELSKGALYLYFASKEELLHAVMTRCQERFLARVEQVAERPGLGLALVAEVMRTYVGLAEELPGQTRLVLQLAAGAREAPPGLEWMETRSELARREIAVVMGLIERGKSDGSIRRNVDAMQVTVQLWAGLMGLFMLRLNGERFYAKKIPNAPPVAVVVHSYVDFFLRGLAASQDQVENLSGVA